MAAARAVLKGLLTWIPGVQAAFYDRTAGGGTASAAYCYGVWLKHLVLLRQHGMTQMPHTVLEIGPGDSLGAGLAALLCGAQRYAAVDTVRHSGAERTRAVLRELVALFQSRAPRPARGWPDFDALLDGRLFPSSILTEDALATSMAPERIARIAEAVARLDSDAQHPMLRYATWRDPAPVGDGQVDLAFSHVVLCMVEDLEGLYSRLGRWVRPGGWMSHQTDFLSRGITPEWNGHLQFGEGAWRVIGGRRPFFVNRARLSTHVALADKYGFDVIAILQRTLSGGIDRSRLAPRWQRISDEDLNCAHAFIIARKRG